MILPYLLVTQILCIFSFVKKSTADNVIYFVVMLFLCTTYFNGSDWRTYEQLYDAVGLIDRYQHWGAGLKVIYNVFNIINFNFHEMLIVCKVLVFFICVIYIKKFCNRPMFAFAIFVMLSGYGIFIDNPLRQMLAIPFFLLSNIFIVKRNLAFFILSLLLGSLFHSSILLFLPVYFLVTKEFKKKYVFICFLVVYLVSISDSLLFFITDFLGSFIPIVSFYGRHYLEGEGRLFNISSFLYLALFYVVNYKIENSNDDFSYQNIQWNLNFLYFLLFIFTVILSIRIPDILRFTYYFGIPFAIFISDSLSGAISKKIFVLFVCLVLSFNLLLTEYKYLPYTNYIYSWATDDLKGYDYRNEFHKKNSLKK